MSIDSISNLNDLNKISNYTVDIANTVRQQQEVDKTKSFSTELNKALNKTSSTESTITKKSDEASLKKVCKDFESVFVNMMLKSMRATVQKSDIFDDSEGGGMAMDTYQGMLDEEYSKEIAKKGIGISDVMYKQLSKQYLK